MDWLNLLLAALAFLLPIMLAAFLVELHAGQASQRHIDHPKKSVAP